MKKKIVILILTVISTVACAFGLLACSEKPNESSNENQGTLQTPTDENNSENNNKDDNDNSQTEQDKSDESDDNNRFEEKPEEETSKLSYLLWDDGYWVTGIGECTDTDIVIPSTYNGLPVNLVSEYSFSGCKSLTSVTISEGITYIGQKAFEGCSSLVSVIMPKSITVVGNNAFYGCTGLTGVYISDLSAWCQIDFEEKVGAYNANPLSYAHNLYLDNKLITDLIIPEEVTYIGICAFTGCTSIKKVTVHDGVTSVGKGALGISTMEEFTGPAIAFATCSVYGSNLKTVTITNGEIKSTYTMGTYYNSTFETLILEDGVTKIGDSAFDSCSSLKEVSIGKGVTEIGTGAFYRCESLPKITIPSNVKIIGSHAFGYCTSLEEVIIESGVEEVGYEAFDRCTSLKKVKVGAAYIDYWAFHFCALKEVILLDGVVELDYCAFDMYESTYLYISKTLKKTSCAFGHWLKNIYYEGTIEQWKEIIKPNWSDDYYCIKRTIHCADGNFEDWC